MEKKVSVITKEGKAVRVMPHMLEDMALFGVTQVKKIVKETPKELIKVPVKQVEKVEVLPEMINTKLPDTLLPPVETKPITKTAPKTPKGKKK
jgi:hypothetical protein